MRALFSGVTGIRSHQIRMDVIGNNIANVNTTGFKSSRVTFMDMFSQLVSGGTQTGVQQVGLGVGVASTDIDQSSGSFQLTGRDMDLSIEGAGFFIQRGNDGQRSFSRAGNFDWDSQGFLVNPGTGQRVQGWLADATGNILSSPTSLGDIQINRSAAALATPTTKITLGQNLDAGAATGTTYDTAFTAYDSLGRPQPIVIRFTKTGAARAWDWSYQTPGGGGFTNAGTLTFNTDGTLPASATGTITYNLTDANNLSIAADFRKITQAYAGNSGSDVQVRQADGNPMGTLEHVSVDAHGAVVGVYSNGTSRPLAQIALATFENPDGLVKSGSSSFSSSAFSGEPSIGRPGIAAHGRIVSGNLEMSNVDLSAEFTNMIMTQRGFQANTRIISTADEMLQDLVNLRR